ncbi:MAG: Uncharacterised protein [Hyphomonas sp. TMED17]|nr:MAG: Uncharacterised protein [Hyphomonas sp. TMED17]
MSSSAHYLANFREAERVRSKQVRKPRRHSRWPIQRLPRLMDSSSMSLFRAWARVSPRGRLRVFQNRLEKIFRSTRQLPKSRLIKSPSKSRPVQQVRSPNGLLLKVTRLFLVRLLLELQKALLRVRRRRRPRQPKRRRRRPMPLLRQHRRRRLEVTGRLCRRFVALPLRPAFRPRRFQEQAETVGQLKRTHCPL